MYPIHCVSSLAVGLLTFVRQGSTSPLQKREPTCTNIVIPVTISAMNAQLSGFLFETLPLDVFFQDIVNSTLSFTQLVSGTYDISARYCEPEVFIAARAGSLQVLVHGINYDKNYWSGLGAPGASYGGTDQYSWVSYASKQGYPTLAIDRLGNGNSSHPDPLLVVQTPAQVEVLHQIILKAKAGTISGIAGRSFQKVVLGGHSYGSVVSKSLNLKYPDDVDATILTGFSSSFFTALVTVIPLVLPVPASTILPAYSSLPPGYMATSSPSGVITLFYWSSSPGQDYDPDLAAFDYSHRGTFGIGELVSMLYADTPADAYTKPLYVVTGEHDYIFCNPEGREDTAACSSNGIDILQETRTLYPNARLFDTYAPPNSGHCWHLHDDAFATFANIHDWLQTQGL